MKDTPFILGTTSNWNPSLSPKRRLGSSLWQFCEIQSKKWIYLSLSCHFSCYFGCHFSCHFSVTQKNFFFLNFPPKFHSNTTLIFTSVFTPTLMMLSFYSTLKTTAEHLFTFQFLLTFHNNNTCNYSICKKRFEKGFLAEIYSLCASEWLLIYLHPIFSHIGYRSKLFTFNSDPKRFLL